ncbi:hypothetical protein CHARACLAT_032716 [Characodon lateralis]|uniref:Uncharacterized protein n=1 Tax=Characodon lateralis TaxID=208331 RepID=A0ABU7E6U7_9TELE|nr:hypothetical protein [Characodon lateralis]
MFHFLHDLTGTLQGGSRFSRRFQLLPLSDLGPSHTFTDTLNLSTTPSGASLLVDVFSDISNPAPTEGSDEHFPR